jgi:hypothetical protein
MLPQLLNIIGGTKVRGSAFSSRASAHASTPEPSTTATAQPSSTSWSASTKSLLTKADTTSSGAITSSVARLMPAMSGWALRPYSHPTRMIRMTGVMMETMRSSMGRRAERAPGQRAAPGGGNVAARCGRPVAGGGLLFWEPLAPVIARACRRRACRLPVQRPARCDG